MVAGGRQFHGSSACSSWFLVRPETIRCSTSVRYASGSTPLSLQVWIKVLAIAQRRAPASEPANNEFFLLCKALHKRNYAHLRIMRRCPATCADSPVDRAVPDALLATNCT